MPDGAIVALPNQEPLFIPDELVEVIADTLLAARGRIASAGLDFVNLEDLMRPNLTLIDGGKKSDDFGSIE